MPRRGSLFSVYNQVPCIYQSRMEITMSRVSKERKKGKTRLILSENRQLEQKKKRKQKRESFQPQIVFQKEHIRSFTNLHPDFYFIFFKRSGLAALRSLFTSPAKLLAQLKLGSLNQKVSILPHLTKLSKSHQHRQRQ